MVVPHPRFATRGSVPGSLHAGLFLPASELKAVRRQAVEALLAARSDHPRAAGLAEAPVLPELLAAAVQEPAPPQALQLISDMSCTTTSPDHPPAAAAAGDADAQGYEYDRVSTGAAAGPSGRQAGSGAGVVKRAGGGGGGLGAAAGADVCIRVMCRSREQVDAALRVPWLREVVVDFLEVLGLKEAVAAVSEYPGGGKGSGSACVRPPYVSSSGLAKGGGGGST